jgi:phage gpG-like protein
MPLRLTVEVSGAEVFDRAFNRIDSLSDLRPIWPNVIREFYLIEVEQFASEGAAGASGKWEPLSDVYAKYKQVTHPDKTILRADDDLFESLTDPEATGAILRPEQNELVIGTSVPYAMVHQKGSSKRNIPARPPISLAEAQKRRIQKSIQAGLVRFVREAGFNIKERAA